MQLILSGHVDGLWARAGVGRAGTGIEPNVPVPREEVGHGCEAASHEETGAASHSEAGWTGTAATPRLQPTCCAIVSRSGPSRSHRRPRAPSTHVG